METVLPGPSQADEALEAARSLKGAILRQEVYALDGSEAADRPYTVSERNYTIEMLQPRGANQNAVFFTHDRESVEFQYDRRLFDVNGRMLADPRAAHSMVLAVDTFGNTTESAAIAYGRRHTDPNPILTEQDHQKQRRNVITYTANRLTNAVLEPDAYRAPTPAESRTYEVLNVLPAANQPDVTNLFRFAEMLGATQFLNDGLHDIPYENVFGVGVDQPARRLIDHALSLYRRDDLNGSLPSGELESLAIPFENYKLVFTTGLLNQVYGDRVTTDMLASEGGYVQLADDDNWWSPSGRVFFSPGENDSPAVELDFALTHFFLPHRFLDPFENSMAASYDSHHLLLVETRDPLGNTVRSENDYRVLQPHLVVDPNGNRTAAAFDALGLLVGTAMRGKENEQQGDSLDGFEPDLDEETIIAHMENPFAAPHGILGHASARLVYDFRSYLRTSTSDNPQPIVVYTVARETHDSDLQPDQLSRIQHSFSYSDGFGREIQKKSQAEPGPVIENGPDMNQRWLGSGWTIFNNKNKPVRQYEPFFSGTHEFEFANTVGVSPILYHDPVGRVVTTLHPNHTWGKTVLDPWRQENWDVNDTVLQDNPRNDSDVGDFFRRLPDDEYLPTWHAQRSNGELGQTLEQQQAEQTAAEKAAVHANTPELIWFDSLGRPFLTVANNRFERQGALTVEQYAARIELDIEGNQREVRDANARTVMRYHYTLDGNQIYSSSMEAGERWLLNDVAGSPIRVWDSRGHTVRTEYDELRRPLRSFVRGVDLNDPDREHLFQQRIYGESVGAALNHRGRVLQVFDGAGVLTSDAYDFKGNLLRGRRQLLVNYRHTVDWNANPPLENEVFVTETSFDALNRPIVLTTPDNSRIRPTFNEANLLERIEVNLRGEDAVTVFVDDVDYNAKGQRERITYGNGVQTSYEFDRETFRVMRMLTMRGNTALQDLSYTYDPTGNFTACRDNAQQVTYFNNQVVEPHSEYTYDAVYRLIEATGREHAGQALQPQTSWIDEFRVRLPHPNDGQAMRRYAEQYEHDEVGNILRLVHQAVNGDWTRAYVYNEPSLIEPLRTGNRLSQTQIAGDVETFTHDAHGNMTRMPHLPLVRWNHLNELAATSQQVVNEGSPETTYYVYDAAGQRIRKVTERQANAEQTPTRRNERIYLDGFEIYREYGVNETVVLERETLHIRDDQQRIALVETRTQGNDDSPVQQIRYQMTNHLGSATLELDAEAAVISYEEYHPYGSTAYQAGRTLVEVSLKRYRYTGQERDEESGLSYHGARYYAPWLGRWIAADPLGIKDGLNVFAYARLNPVNLLDRAGTFAVAPMPDDDAPAAEWAAYQAQKADEANEDMAGWRERKQSQEFDRFSDKRLVVDPTNAHKVWDHKRGEGPAYLDWNTIEEAQPRQTFKMTIDRDAETVTVDVRLHGLRSPRNTEENKAKIEAAIETTWNDKVTLSLGKETYKVRVDVQWVDTPEAAHRNVEFAPEKVVSLDRPGRMDRFRDSVTDDTARIDITASAAAHEFGHILGVHDQYKLRQVTDREGNVRYINPKNEIAAGREIAGIMFDSSLAPLNDEFSTIRRAFADMNGVRPSDVVVNRDPAADRVEEPASDEFIRVIRVPSRR